MASAAPESDVAPAGSSPVLAEEDQEILLNDLAQRINDYLHDVGRVAALAEVRDIVFSDPEVSRSLGDFMLCSHDDKFWQFVDCQAMMFYTMVIDGVQYVALSRTMTYLYPRLCPATVKLIDPAIDSVIFGDETWNEPTVGVGISLTEYEYVKCALTILELLDVIFKCFKKGKQRTPIDKVLAECQKLNTMTKSMLTFCATDGGDMAGGLKKFLSVIGGTFVVEGDTITINRPLYQALRYTFEMDLVWSFGSTRISAEGCISIPKLAEKIAAFAIRARFKRMPTVSLHSLREFIQALPEVFFYPKDDTVSLMDACVHIEDDGLWLLERFYMNYLKSSPDHSFHYKDCYEILEKENPELLKYFPAENYLTIACYLFIQVNLFTFAAGRVTLSERVFPNLNCYLAVVPTEVPTDFLVDSVLPPIITDRAHGRARDIGMRSAVIRVFRRGMFAQSVSANIYVNAFCHVDITRFGGVKIENFSDFIETDDIIEFTLEQFDTLTPDRPCYLVVTNILGLMELESSSEKSTEFEDYLDSPTREGMRGPRRTGPEYYSKLVASKTTKAEESSTDTTESKACPRRSRRTAKYDFFAHCPQCRSESTHGEQMRFKLSTSPAVPPKISPIKPPSVKGRVPLFGLNLVKSPTASPEKATTRAMSPISAGWASSIAKAQPTPPLTYSTSLFGQQYTSFTTEIHASTASRDVSSKPGIPFVESMTVERTSTTVHPVVDPPSGYTSQGIQKDENVASAILPTQGYLTNVVWDTAPMVNMGYTNPFNPFASLRQRDMLSRTEREQFQILTEFFQEKLPSYCRKKYEQPLPEDLISIEITPPTLPSSELEPKSTEPVEECTEATGAIPKTELPSKASRKKKTSKKPHPETTVDPIKTSETKTDLNKGLEAVETHEVALTAAIEQLSLKNYIAGVSVPSVPSNLSSEEESDDTVDPDPPGESFVTRMSRSMEDPRYARMFLVSIVKVVALRKVLYEDGQDTTIKFKANVPNVIEAILEMEALTRIVNSTKQLRLDVKKPVVDVRIDHATDPIYRIPLDPRIPIRVQFRFTDNTWSKKTRPKSRRGSPHVPSSVTKKVGFRQVLETVDETEEQDEGVAGKIEDLPSGQPSQEETTQSPQETKEPTFLTKEDRSSD